MKRLLFSVMMLMGLMAMQAAAAPKANPADTDGDGKVSQQEYCDAQALNAAKDGKQAKPGAAKKQFKAKDLDGDGFLSGDELQGKSKAPKASESDDTDDTEDNTEE